MVTASHNPEQDNGAKLVDPMGEMLEAAWEAHAARLANCSDQELPSVYKAIAAETQVDTSIKARVAIGSDTRKSSPGLVQAAKDGCSAVGAHCDDFGLMTTPQLHYVVRCLNDPDYGTATEQGYYDKHIAAFDKLMSMAGVTTPVQIKLDCANGVGADKFDKMRQGLSSYLKLDMCNTGDGPLNENCGADYVKVQQCPPSNMTMDANDRCASFDGDADRLVYYCQHQGSFCLLDGDRIASLAADFINEMAAQAGVELGLGVVQTAYANGGSSHYLQSVAKVPVEFTKTGVKHLHHKAVEFGVGVYFEANGHGTVLFNESALKAIESATPQDDKAKRALEILTELTKLINQTVGDAISDMLMVEAILALKNMQNEQWVAMYQDLPNRQLKVKVADRTAIETTDAERRCVAPAGLQDAINALVEQAPNGRSFVRPSGTEDVVRVYAEAATREAADKLAYAVANKVYDMAKGVGDRPAP
eukprot:TRINITY_DN1339_c0_g1_i1.p1 TRINITY_DN1339_c0_g1~~TRINITY_DN1339_c0_g1_i1.p1  ORF type:complete len:531 (+),score=124.34 TRINITY_DN1339_c0_g1_i1:168-1595(+)